MATFGISRNIETSLEDYLNYNLTYYGRTNVAVTKSFKDSEKAELPFLVVKVGDTFHNKIEIGSNSTIRNFNIVIDVYHESRGQVLDLKDFLIGILKDGFPYYNYIIAENALIAKVYDGRVYTNSNIRDFNTNENLDISNIHETERFRQTLVIEATLMKVEIAQYSQREVAPMETIKIERVCGENINVYEFVYINNDELFRADYKTFDSASAIGMSRSTYLLGETGQVIVFGEVENLAWNFESGKVVYLAEDGLLTQDITSLLESNKYLIKVGRALTDTKLLVNPELEVVGVS